MFVLLNKTFIALSVLHTYPASVLEKRWDVPAYSYYAILQYKGIIFVAGLKADKFKRYVGILSAPISLIK